MRTSLILDLRIAPPATQGFGRKGDIHALYLAKSAVHGGFAKQSLTRARRVLKTPRTPVITLCIMQTAVCGLRYVYYATMEGKAILATFCRPLGARQENIEAKLPGMAVLGSFCLDGRTRPALVRRIDILLSSHSSSESVNRSHECRTSMLHTDSKFSLSKNILNEKDNNMKLRPCIDIHNGKVKQIVGSSLQDAGDKATDNFVSEKDGAYYARLYQEKGLAGGHAILLNAKDSEYYEATKAQAMLALSTVPGLLEVGGGITADNAREFIDKGASHVIVTSFVFADGVIKYDRC